jgi:hypothetical protein
MMDAILTSSALRTTKSTFSARRNGVASARRFARRRQRHMIGYRGCNRSRDGNGGFTLIKMIHNDSVAVVG